MKKYIALVLALVLAISLLLTGCASSGSSNPENVEGDRTMDFDPRGEKNSDTTYVPLAIEKEDIFTERDLAVSPNLSEAVSIPAKSDSEYTITTEGVYLLSGKATNFTVKVEADKKDKVQIVLNGATVTNEDFPVIYVKSADKCFVTSLESNTFSVNGTFKFDGDIKTDAVIFSKADLTLNGTGSLTIVSKAGNGISAKDDLKITGGKYNITSALDGLEANDSVSICDGQFSVTSGKDAIHSENDSREGSVYISDGTFTLDAKSDGIQATTYLVVDGGTFTITAEEGLEATYVQINDGKIQIQATDDGINAARKSNGYEVVIEINGGETTVSVGAGDTDCLDANGIIVVNGGTIDVTGKSTFDADRGTVYNDGTVIVNGTVVDTIPQSEMGGFGGGDRGGMPGKERFSDRENFGGRDNRPPTPPDSFGKEPGNDFTPSEGQSDC